MKKYSIIEIAGGIGKSIMATAIIDGIKAEYPERDILVVTAYPEVFLNNPQIHKVFRFGNCPYFYRDYVNNCDVKFFCEEPYRSFGYLNQDRHLIKAWGDCLDIPVEISPKIYLNSLEEQSALNGINIDKPLVIFQPFGGAAEQANNYSWNRDIPPHQAQIIADNLSRNFHVVQPVHDRHIKLNNCEHVSLPLRNLFVLIKYAQHVIGIDSFVQHARKALGGISTVCWVTNKPLVFGYEGNNNVLPRLEIIKSNSDIDGYFHEYDFSGSRMYDYPFDGGDIFDLEQVLVEPNMFLMQEQNKKRFMNDYFDQIYVINLDRRKDRWEKIESELKRVNIDNYERISGVDISEDDILDQNSVKNFKTETVTSEELLPKYIRGAYGCRESHINCIKDAKKNFHKTILILEDDVAFNSQINENLDHIIRNTKEEWDVLYLGGDYWEDGSIFQTCGYILKASTFDYILDNYEKDGEELDFFYVNKLQQNFKVLKVMPPLLEQTDFNSDIPTTYISNDSK